MKLGDGTSDTSQGEHQKKGCVPGEQPGPSLNVVFLHPDLGIGGAERLVVDAGLALIRRGHSVTYVTGHHDKSHCFEETRNGTLDVTVVGDWLPRSILGRCYALCAYIRMIYAALYLVLFSHLKPDVVFVDQISACLPILSVFRYRTVFYCHFPDQLLTQRNSRMKRIYRAPIDWLEEVTTGMADTVLVNSKFTAGVFSSTFKRLSHLQPGVLYPSLDTEDDRSNSSSGGDMGQGDNLVKTGPEGDSLANKGQGDTALPLQQQQMKWSELQSLFVDPYPSSVSIPEDAFVFLSINRYERKKNLALALHAFEQLLRKSDSSSRLYLLMVGGYDSRVVENVEHFSELTQLVADDVRERVVFLRSPSDQVKRLLLTHCHCLLYTPSNEHFGIVPLEAMHRGMPVIAVNSGGPTETVANGETGFLCSATADSFASAMLSVIQDEKRRVEMGERGRQRVQRLFSYQAFADQLEACVLRTSRGGRVKTKGE